MDILHQGGTPQPCPAHILSDKAHKHHGTPLLSLSVTTTKLETFKLYDYGQSHVALGVVRDLLGCLLID
jgi:hypothetical protein